MAVNPMALIPNSTDMNKADWEQNSTTSWHNGYCSCFSIQSHAKSNSHTSRHKAVVEWEFFQH